MSNKFFDDEYAARALYLLVKPVPPHLDMSNNFNRVMVAVRELIDKLPTGPLKLRQLAIAYRYIMNRKPSLAPHPVKEDVSLKAEKVMFLEMVEFIIENELRLVEDEYEVRKAMDLLTEDDAGPANSVTGIQPTDEPVIDPATKKNKKNMDTRRAYDNLFNRSEAAGE